MNQEYTIHHFDHKILRVLLLSTHNAGPAGPPPAFTSCLLSNIFLLRSSPLGASNDEVDPEGVTISTVTMGALVDGAVERARMAGL
jgi:hypothetical protein